MGMDYNDLCQRGGKKVVVTNLFAGRAAGPLTPEGLPPDPNKTPAPPVSEVPLTAYDSEPEQPEPISPAPSDAGSADDFDSNLDDTGRFTIASMLKHFWHVWGTDTLWDNVSKRQMRLSHLRHGVGRERYKFWEDSSLRRTVLDIRFEPGVDLGWRYVNLYDGLEMQPDPMGVEGCQRILEHILLLCGNRKDEFEWLLNWIALPLQKPGTKMASSVIMYGTEGPGKSLLWEEIVKRIYGKYAVTIGQAQLESQFNSWRSAKLFALAEEVVSRSERNHHKGMLKQIVTGATHMINEKMLPEHEERNCMNFVFLSNSTVPLELDMGDRRYLVLYINQKPPKSYFERLVHEINNGGVECFYQYLLQRPLGKFNAHTEPPINAEKRELIGASLPAPVYFHQLWRDGELDLPYRSAVAGDLFKAFKKWCEDNNEFKRTERYFGTELKRVMPQVRINIHYPEQLSSHVTKRIYVTEQDMEKQGEPGFADALAESCREFAGALNQGL